MSPANQHKSKFNVDSIKKITIVRIPTDPLSIVKPADPSLATVEQMESIGQKSSSSQPLTTEPSTLEKDDSLAAIDETVEKSLSPSDSAPDTSQKRNKLTYRCEKCDKSFLHLRSLKTHELKIHKED